MNRRHSAIAAIAAASVLWGTTGAAATFATSVSAMAIGAGAMGIGGLLQGIVNSAAIRRWHTCLRAEWIAVVTGALCVVLYPIGFYTSMRVAGVALGSVVSLASAPLASAVIERILDGRRLTKQWALACACAVVGAALLCAPHGAQPGNGSAAAGVALGLLAGITYAGYSKALRHLMSQRIPRNAATGAIFGLGGVALMPVLIIAGGAAIAAAPSALVVIGYLALIPMFLGYVLFSYGLGGVDATTATTITLIEPAVATLAAVAILGEDITGLGWLGIALLATALAVLLNAPAAGSGRETLSGTTELTPQCDRIGGV